MTAEQPSVVGKASGYRAQTPRAAAEEINRLFADPTVTLVVSAIGGLTTNAVLDDIDWRLLERNPKIICGYSDTTALLLAIYAVTNQVVLHGPALLPQWGDPKGALPASRAAFRTAVTGAKAKWTLRSPRHWISPRTDWRDDSRSFRDNPKHEGGWLVLARGTSMGRLVGGNIETMNMVLGTKYAPSFKDAILFFEAVGSEAHLPRMHRALMHLRQCGVFDSLKGVIAGRCPDALPVDGVSLADLLMDVFSSLHVPIIANVDIGHSEPILTLPIGCLAELRAGANGATLTIVEKAVR